MLINGYKKDAVSEDGSLLAPDVTNGLVLYINSNLKNAKPVEIARIVAKLAPRQDVNINALCASIKRAQEKNASNHILFPHMILYRFHEIITRFSKCEISKRFFNTLQIR